VILWRKLEQIRQGVEAGGPISPLLFNLVVDVLNRMLEKAAEGG